MATFSLFMKENRRTIVQRWPTEIRLNLKPAWSKGKQVKKRSRCEEPSSNQSQQKEQKEFTSTCGNFLFDQEKPYRKRKGIDDKS